MFEDANQIVSRCPHCNQGYRIEEAQEIEVTDDSTTVYAECSRCRSSIIAVVAMSGLGVVSLGMVTDMNREDIYRFRASGPISSNELLEIIQSLKQGDRAFVNRIIGKKDVI